MFQAFGFFLLLFLIAPSDISAQPPECAVDAVSGIEEGLWHEHLLHSSKRKTLRVLGVGKKGKPQKATIKGIEPPKNGNQPEAFVVVRVGDVDVRVPARQVQVQGGTVRFHNDELVKALKLGPPDLPAGASAPARPCCKSLSSGKRKASVRKGTPASGRTAQDAEDAYYAGSGARKPHELSEHYEYTAPETIRGAEFPGGNYTIPDKSYTERLLDVLPRNRRDPKQYTFAGAGSQSHAYFVHPPIPDEVMALIKSAPSPKEGYAIRRAWAEANAQRVVKLRNPNPWGQGMTEAANQIRRDISMRGVAEQLAAQATYDGQPFIRVARITSSHKQHMAGVIVTEPIKGPSVYQLQDAIDTIRGAGKHPSSFGFTQDGAEKYLKEAGLTVDEASDRISALEQFYRDTHDDVMKFQKENGITGVANRRRPSLGSENTKEGSDLVAVAFDFNHGSNVIWDKVKKQFVMVDW